ncbi:MAG: FdtA/QdtA family cupin domain-containing protein [Bacteroidota bacterium]
MDHVKIIDLQKIEDPRGNLTFVEQLTHIPFEIKRAYWIYDVPGGQSRGGHAFVNQKEFIIALSGSFDVIINDGKQEQRFHMNRSYFGLYIPNGLWRSMDNFSTNSVVLVLSSTTFNENDYIRDFNKYQKQIKHEQ